MKLCHIKRDHHNLLKCPPSTETHAGWSHLIWHNCFRKIATSPQGVDFFDSHCICILLVVLWIFISLWEIHWKLWGKLREFDEDWRVNAQFTPNSLIKSEIPADSSSHSTSTNCYSRLTAVLAGLIIMFCSWCLFPFLLSPPNLLNHSIDRHQTLPHIWWSSIFINVWSIWGPCPKIWQSKNKKNW